VIEERGWGKQQGGQTEEESIGWRKMLIEGAASGGRLDILLWAKTQGLVSRSGALLGEYPSKNLELLKWLKKEGILQLTKRHVVDAIGRCDIYSVKWILRKYPELIPTDFTTNLFNVGKPHDGEFEMVKFLRTFPLPWPEWSSEDIARSGKVEILKWARKHGCPWGIHTCSTATQIGNFELLKWARKHGCPWNEWTCTDAVRRGDFEILKWAREQGCPWNEETGLEIIRSNNHEMLAWAYEKGLPIARDAEICDRIGASGNLESLKWARDHGFPWGRGHGPYDHQLQKSRDVGMGVRKRMPDARQHVCRDCQLWISREPKMGA
jgi:hypothetical protein